MNNKDNGVKRDCPIDCRKAGRSDGQDRTADGAAERKTPRENAAETTRDCSGTGPRRGSSTEPTADNSTGTHLNTGQSVLLTDGGQVLEAVSDDRLLEQALDLTHFQISQLAIAVGEPKSGQEILDELNELPFGNEVTHGRQYPNLDVLVGADLIEKHDRDRRTHEYPATSKGEKLLSVYVDWLEGEIDHDRTASEPSNTHAVELTHFQFAALALLDGERVSGQAVKDGLEEATGEEVYHGRLYPNLDALVDNDLVEKGTTDQRTNSYEVTDAGHNVLAARLEWLRDQGAASGGEK